jgi:GNAT superfamily N-acetyltransferase
MEWRHLRDDDLEDVARLLRRALPYDPLTDAEVRFLLSGDPGYDPALAWVAVAGEAAGAAGGGSRGRRVVGLAAGASPDEVLQAPAGIKLFAVAPEYRRRGVATRLLDLVEEALRARGVTRCAAVNCGTNRLALGLDVRYTAALCLLWQRGYERTGTTQDMIVDLAGPDAPSLDTTADEARLEAAGVVFRRAGAADRVWVEAGVARELATSVPGRRWAYLAGLAFRSDPPAIEVAADRETGAWLGFAAYDVARLGSLGPMGVAPGSRARGAGAVLLKRCLRDLRDAGYPRAEIFAVGPIPFYAKTVGARFGRIYYQYTRTL